MSGIKKITGFKIFWLIILIGFNLHLISSPIDSTKVISDSTLVSQTDSLYFPTKNELIKLLSYDKNKKTHNTFLPFSISENFHIYLPYQSYKPFFVNGFLSENRNFSSSLSYLLLTPFYDYESVFYNDFYQKIYVNCVPVLYSNAGTGSENMNFVHADFYKGNLKNLFDFNFSYLGKEGLWHQNNNPSKDFHLYTRLKTKLGSLSLTKDIFENTIPDFYILSNSDSLKTLSLKQNRTNLIYNFKGFNLAVQNISTKIKNKTETETQFYLSQKIRMPYLEIEPKFQTTNNQNKNYYYHIKSYFNYSKFLMQSVFINRNFEKNYISSHLEYHQNKDFSYSLNYHNDMIFYDFISEDVSIKYKKAQISFGQKQKNSSKTFFSSIKQDNSFKIKLLDFYISTNLIYHKKFSKYFPMLHYRGLFKISEELNHDNKIFVGAEYHFLTNDKHWNYYDIYLNSFIGVQITRYFTLKADFINLTNEYSYSELLLMPYHINFSFNWLFFN